ncbi:hypothetical protein PFISCL1PPCAC_26828, partial [Pristionchus fissidentatus]
HSYLVKASEHSEKVESYRKYLQEKAKIISEKYNLSTTLERLKSEVEEVIIFATKIAEIIKNGGAQNIPMKL